MPTAEIAAAADRLGVRPVFTAHPTEAARRSILTKLRAIADELDAEASRAALLRPGRRATPARSEHRLAELIDTLWQTDELRLTRPDPRDEARNAVYYLTDLAADAAPQVLADLATIAAASSASTVPTDRAAADVRHLDRRRPRRQPVRHAGGHPRRAADPARARHPHGRGGACRT